MPVTVDQMRQFIEEFLDLHSGLKVEDFVFIVDGSEVTIMRKSDLPKEGPK